MGLLARAPEADLVALWEAAGLAPVFDWVRPPQQGSVMVRGRAGATGAPFNLGEMTVTRGCLRLATGAIGHAYVAGRSARKAEIAALCDALMQEPESAPAVEAAILAPLRARAAARAEDRAAKAAATRVEFFTLARGDNP